MPTQEQSIGSFIEQAPPGELNNVVNDIKALLGPNASLDNYAAAFKKYNEEQFTTVKLLGGSQEAIVSQYNQLSNDRYFDSESQTSFAFDHTTRKASATQSHTFDSKHSDLIKSLVKTYTAHASEHYPASSVGIFPSSSDTEIHLVLVANKYSPNNFWNGRWRSQYTLDTSSGNVNGKIYVDVHYYEDGNVRMLTDKAVSLSVGSSPSGPDVVKQIAVAEKKYQEDLNRAFGQLSEGAFKGLRRQLPVTRQRIEWDKISGYRLGQDIGGGRTR